MTARMTINDKNVHEKVIKEVMKELWNISFDKTLPEIFTSVHKKVKEITNCKDPYNEVKKNLFAAIKFSIAGNVIGFGRPRELNITKILREINIKKLAINVTFAVKEKPIINDTTNHAKNRDKIIPELFRVCKENGYLIILELNKKGFKCFNKLYEMKKTKIKHDENLQQLLLQKKEVKNENNDSL